MLLRPMDPRPVLWAVALLAAVALRAPLPEYEVGAIALAAVLLRLAVSVRAAIRIEVHIHRA